MTCSLGSVVLCNVQVDCSRMTANIVYWWIYELHRSTPKNILLIIIFQSIFANNCELFYIKVQLLTWRQSSFLILCIQRLFTPRSSNVCFQSSLFVVITCLIYINSVDSAVTRKEMCTVLECVKLKSQKRQNGTMYWKHSDITMKKIILDTSIRTRVYIQIDIFKRNSFPKWYR